MRDKVSVFYYPDMDASNSTIKKAILFFDEIHFVDRPSLSFGKQGTWGSFTTVGCPSSFRELQPALKQEGIAAYVHPATVMGPVSQELYSRISADINDRAFLDAFQTGLKASPAFANLQVKPGNYGRWGGSEEVLKLISTVDLNQVLAGYPNPTDLFADPTIYMLDLSTPAGCAKNLLMHAHTCSANINLALDISSKNGIVPLADATPFAKLLGAKYQRAMKGVDAQKHQIPVTDLAFAVFDELVDGIRLDQMTYREVIDYRRKSDSPREQFLEYLSTLQAKCGGTSDDYTSEITALMKTEIIPAARAFRNKLAAIDDALYGTVAKTVVGGILGASGLEVLLDLSWSKLVTLAAVAGPLAVKTIVDDYLASRAARRECAVSYVLSLNK
jgi:hypothetical protein